MLEKVIVVTLNDFPGGFLSKTFLKAFEHQTLCLLKNPSCENKGDLERLFNWKAFDKTSYWFHNFRTNILNLIATCLQAHSCFLECILSNKEAIMNVWVLMWISEKYES